MEKTVEGIDVPLAECGSVHLAEHFHMFFPAP
jgi:hypothetical protein